MAKIRIAFIKFGGLTTGGTERWLQMMAAHLNPQLFQVDYYYCDAPGTDSGRLLYLEQHGVRVIPFKVGKRDLTSATWEWRDTNFWDVFKEADYDLIQTAKSREAEYPFYLMKKPVIEYRTLMGLPDHTGNIGFSIHLSQWQRSAWFLRGGDLSKSAVIPIPTELPATTENLRQALQIPADAVVAGFHQRVDNAIASAIPLAAFALIKTKNAYFVMMGGGSRYKDQARQIGLSNIRFIDHSGSPIDISRFLNTLDIFAHGRSDGETFGTVFAEALIHGKPCLSHRVPHGANGQEETMGPAGLFADNEQDYAFHLKTLFDSSPARQQLAGKARAHAEKYFLIDKAVQHLETIYHSLLRPSTSTTRVFSYGKSPLGFFYYGRTEDSHDMASHVVTQRIPDEFYLDLIQHLKGQVSTFLDMQTNDGLYGFYMAYQNPQSQIFILGKGSDHSASLRETAWLNNWESRVHIRSIDPENIPLADFLKIDIPPSSPELPKSLETIIARSKPIVFIKNEMTASAFELLRHHGYVLWRCMNNGYCKEMKELRAHEDGNLYMALHQEKHRLENAQVPHWAACYRRRKRVQRIRKFIYLTVKAFRHPRRAAVALCDPSMSEYGLRF